MITWYSHHPGGWGWGWWPGIVWTILLGALLAGAIYLAWRRPALAAAGPVRPATAAAEAVLAERYARGDIDADEYRDRLAVLHDHPDSTPGP